MLIFWPATLIEIEKPLKGYMMSTCVTLLNPIDHQLEQVLIKLGALAKRLGVSMLLFGAIVNVV